MNDRCPALARLITGQLTALIGNTAAQQFVHHKIESGSVVEYTRTVTATVSRANQATPEVGVGLGRERPEQARMVREDLNTRFASEGFCPHNTMHP